MDRKKITKLLLSCCLAFASAVDGASQSKSISMLEVEKRLSDLGYWILKVDGRVDASTRHAIMAFQKVEGRKRTGTMTAVDLKALREAARPSPLYTPGVAHVEVDISKQVLFFVDEAGTVLRILPISSGNDKRYLDEGRWQVAITPRGLFNIERKVNGVRKASLGDLYYPSYFSSGVAIHGSNSIPPYPASHGCVRVPRFADQALFRMLKVGMEVYVYD